MAVNLEKENREQAETIEELKLQVSSLELQQRQGGETIGKLLRQIEDLKKDKQDMRLQPEQLARAIDNHCNTFDRSGDFVLIKELANSHRTIQQTIFQLVIRMLLKFADQWDRADFDARNKAACAVAARLRDYMRKEEMIFQRGEDESQYDIYLPCI